MNADIDFQGGVYFLVLSTYLVLLDYLLFFLIRNLSALLCR